MEPSNLFINTFIASIVVMVAMAGFFFVIWYAVGKLLQRSAAAPRNRRLPAETILKLTNFHDKTEWGFVGLTLRLWDLLSYPLVTAAAFQIWYFTHDTMNISKKSDENPVGLTVLAVLVLLWMCSWPMFVSWRLWVLRKNNLENDKPNFYLYGGFAKDFLYEERLFGLFRGLIRTTKAMVVAGLVDPIAQTFSVFILDLCVVVAMLWRNPRVSRMENIIDISIVSCICFQSMLLVIAAADVVSDVAGLSGVMIFVGNAIMILTVILTLTLMVGAVYRETTHVDDGDDKANDFTSRDLVSWVKGMLPCFGDKSEDQAKRKTDSPTVVQEIRAMCKLLCASAVVLEEEAATEDGDDETHVNVEMVETNGHEGETGETALSPDNGAPVEKQASSAGSRVSIKQRLSTILGMRRPSMHGEKPPLAKAYIDRSVPPEAITVFMLLASLLSCANLGDERYCEFDGCCEGEERLHGSALETADGAAFFGVALGVLLITLFCICAEQRYGIPRLPDSYVFCKMVSLCIALPIWCGVTINWAVHLSNLFGSSGFKIGVATAFFSMPCFAWLIFINKKALDYRELTEIRRMTSNATKHLSRLSIDASSLSPRRWSIRTSKSTAEAKPAQESASPAVEVGASSSDSNNQGDMVGVNDSKLEEKVEESEVGSGDANLNTDEVTVKVLVKQVSLV